MYMLLMTCVAWAGLVLVLTVIFDIWVYLVTKDFDFVLSAWLNRHKTFDRRLLPKQAALLKAIGLIERGLGYFGLFVIVPFYAFSKL